VLVYRAAVLSVVRFQSSDGARNYGVIIGHVNSRDNYSGCIGTRLRTAATLIGYLVNPSFPGVDVLAKEASNAAKALGIAVHVLNASTEHDLDTVFASLVRFLPRIEF
jgi:hypothetical protein